MTRFYGAVGFATSTEVRPGIWEDAITERSYFGEVIRNSRRLQASDESVNDDLTVENSISIVADAYASEHFFAVRFVRWSGAVWEVPTVEVHSPRLTLRLGGVYNGPVAPPADP
jgi:hypothetical protein